MSTLVRIGCEEFSKNQQSNSLGSVNQTFNKKFVTFRHLLRKKFSKREQTTQDRSQKSHIIEAVTNSTIFESQNKINELKGRASYSCCSIVKMNRQTLTLEIFSELLRNQFPIQPKSRQFRLLLCRYLNNLNSALRDGQFQVNPFNGHISFKMVNLLSLTNFSYFVFNPEIGISFVESELRSVTLYVRYNILKILYMMQELSPQFVRIAQTQRESIRNFQKSQCIDRLRLIKKVIKLSNYEFDFMLKEGIGSELKPQQIARAVEKSKKSMIQSTKRTLEQKKRVNQIRQNLANFNQDVYFDKRSYAETKDFLVQYEQRFVRHLCFAKIKQINYFERIGIFSQIHIYDCDNLKWQLIGQGGFSQIRKSLCNFTYIGQANRHLKKQQLKFQGVNYKKLLSRKVEKDQKKDSKINHQKQILSKLRYKTCANILKFYQTQQLALKNDLLMDYCIFRSLNIYKKVNSFMISQLTNLYILAQMVDGLRFLRDMKIIHLDIKPQNMLICRGLILKITDFGQSYHPSVSAQDYRPGFTLPYTAPEVFYTIIPYQKKQKIDVYSFGVIMYQTLFDSFPFEVRRIKMSQMMTNYTPLNDTANILPEKSSIFGPSCLMENLCLLSLKCLDKIAENRPSLDWISIILKESILYLESMY